jgi:hypothetical protein
MDLKTFESGLQQISEVTAMQGTMPDSLPAAGQSITSANI